MPDALPPLLSRIEAATGADLGLDGRIAWAFGWRFDGFPSKEDTSAGPDTVEAFDDWPNLAGSWKKPGDPYFYGDSGLSVQEFREGERSGRWDEPPAWTASVDAVLALIEQELPGWGMSVSLKPGLGSWACINEPDAVVEIVRGEAATPALALLAALIRAKIAQTEEAHA